MFGSVQFRPQPQPASAFAFYERIDHAHVAGYVGCTPSYSQYSAFQMNVVKGCVSAVLVHATFDYVNLDSRVQLHVLQ